MTKLLTNAELEELRRQTAEVNTSIDNQTAEVCEHDINIKECTICEGIPFDNVIKFQITKLQPAARIVRHRINNKQYKDKRRKEKQARKARRRNR